jgi:molybdenum cofactor guanylyltransferase
MNCYVLSGGKSSRIGRPKQALEIGGRTFLDAVHEAAASVFERVVVVTKAAGDSAGFTAIREVETDLTAPILGLARASEDAGDEPFFVLAVDYPLMRPELLRALRARFEATGADIVAPRYGGKIHVLCAGYRPAVRATLRRKLESGDYRLQGLLDLHASEIVELDDLAGFGDALLNVNTMDDYETARAIHGKTIQR